MRTLLPYPILSLFLFGMWLLLNQSVSPGQVMLAVIVGISGSHLMSTLQLPSGSIRRPGAIARLAWIVLVDILRSNLAVAQIVLTRRKAKSGFLTIPLELRNPYALTILACIITSTPGTVWVSFDSAKGDLIIHVLDLVDEQAWIKIIKHRYEQLLVEIFE